MWFAFRDVLLLSSLLDFLTSPQMQDRSSLYQISAMSQKSNYYHIVKSWKWHGLGIGKWKDIDREHLVRDLKCSSYTVSMGRIATIRKWCFGICSLLITEKLHLLDNFNGSEDSYHTEYLTFLSSEHVPQNVTDKPGFSDLYSKAQFRPGGT